MPATVAAAIPPAPAGWTDLADLALAADVVLIGTIRSVDRLGRRDAPGVPEGQLRALVEVDLSAVLKAPGLLPARAAWLWQGLAPRKRLPFAKSEPVIVFAHILEGGGNPEVQALSLVSPHGQQPWSAAAEAEVRAILEQALAPGNAARMVTAVSDAAHNEGAIAGESESQFFLATDTGRPITLVVRRSSGQPPQILAATGDLVDRAAPIEQHTLIWRALACGMPAALPPQLAATDGLARDYATARTAIGRCGRLLTPPG